MCREITKEQAREIFLSLVRGATQTWAGYELSGDLERCEGLVFTVLNIFDGNTGVLPALDIIARPHPDDMAYHIEEGENYYPYGLVINDDCSLHEMWHNRPADEVVLPDGGPRALTKVEIRNHVLDLMRDYAQYWSSVADRTSASRCEGLGFSLLNIFDGTCPELPGFDIVTRPQEEAREHDIAHGRDYFAPGLVINDDVLLHDLYYER